MHVGDIPRELGNATTLTDMVFQVNQLTGTLINKYSLYALHILIIIWVGKLTSN